MGTYSHDKRIDGLADRLVREFTGPDGGEADPHHIVEVVQAKAHELDDAPIQDFVPLLAEHKAVEELRGQGLRRELPGGPEAPVHDAGGDIASGDGVPTAK
jgi:hypothetical protein